MADIQKIYDQIQAAKSEQKELKKIYRDALKNDQSYQVILDKIKAMREQKKQIEDVVKHDMGSNYTKIEDLQIDIDMDQEMLSDMAMTQLMKGETVEIKDEHDNQYEPVFSVKFKKVG